MAKDNIREILILKGRALVRDYGAEFLTARKLAEASGYSVGTIYNQFANMDNFVMTLNMQTLDELHDYLLKLTPDSNAYKSLNRYLDGFVTFVLANQNLWFLLFNFHLRCPIKRLVRQYVYRLVLIMQIWEPCFEEVFKNLKPKERRLSMQVLWLAVFSMSSFLTTPILDRFGKINKKTVCKLLLNTYLAGLASLEKD